MELMPFRSSQPISLRFPNVLHSCKRRSVFGTGALGTTAVYWFLPSKTFELKVAAKLLSGLLNFIDPFA